VYEGPSPSYKKSTANQRKELNNEKYIQLVTGYNAVAHLFV